jgi:diphosphomevalonate decarboxylase
VKITRAYANANIALVKYWGKSDLSFNIPAVPSLSMTFDNIGTSVVLAPALDNKHSLKQENLAAQEKALLRLSSFLEIIRARIPYDGYLDISTTSNVPYQAGLASSAAFFAALIKALDNFYEFNLSPQELSKLARIGSASAARSMLGGFVGLHGGLISDEDAYAFEIKLDPSLKLAMIVGIVSAQPKAISSREAMILTQETSPYYSSWLKSAPDDFKYAKKALEDGSFSQLGAIMEHSTLKMHASMWASKPAINYFLPSTLALMSIIIKLRETYGPIAYFTMDAGPNIKILCEDLHINLIKDTLLQSALCEEIFISYPGSGAQVIS